MPLPVPCLSNAPRQRAPVATMPPRRSPASRAWPALAVVAAALLGLSAAQAHAVGRLVEVTVIDRATGEALPVHRHQGRWWVEGRPGARYAVQLDNRSGDRTLAVLAVDGVNAVTGATAAPLQTGYVLAPGQRAAIVGWRKSDTRAAAFEFTALPESYAALTGRPDHVGVIGVAVFRERSATPPVPAVSLPVERVRPEPMRESPAAPTAANARADDAAADAADGAPAAANADGAARARSMAPPARAERLGTGHGAVETSVVRSTAFERASDTPAEVITLHYDSRARLIALGVITPLPDPFPAAQWVPDPPRR